MLLFVNEDQDPTQSLGRKSMMTLTWIGTSTPDFMGFFSHQANGKQHNNQFYLNQDYLYYYDTIKQSYQAFPLMLSSILQKYCLKNSKKIYGIKLYNSTLQLKTCLYTHSEQDFIKLFSLLSMKCVMRNFHDNYKLTNKIADGMLGEIYFATHIVTEHEVVVKTYFKQHLNNEKYNLVINELTNLYTLKLTSLSPLLEVYETFQCIVLIFKKANDGTLIDFIKKNQKNYNLSIIKDIIKQLLKCLEVVHTHGIIHRDIKPQNILFEGSELILIDYGISITSQTFNNPSYNYFNSGSIGFVSQEVLNYRHQVSQPYTTKSDIFSVGCLLYFLLTGRTLFTNAEEVQESLIQKKINQLKLCQMGKAMLRKMLSTNPEERISAKEAGNQQFLKGTENGLPYTFNYELNSAKRHVLTKKITDYWSKV